MNFGALAMGFRPPVATARGQPPAVELIDRLYVEAYLRSHPRVNGAMSFLVRELQDSNYGIPLQIYIFLNTVIWAEYEAIQADIFDYLYSVMRLFDLEAYQYESETSKGYETGAA